MRRREERRRKLALEVVFELIKEDVSGGGRLIGAMHDFLFS